VDGGNTMSIENYYQEYMQEIYFKSEADEDFHETSFTEDMCDFLVEQGVIETYQLGSFIKKAKGIKVDAWNYNEEKELLTLFITDFSASSEMSSLTKSEMVSKHFKRVEKFFKESLSPKFVQSLEESSLGYEIALEILTKADSISRINFILLSNGFLSKRVTGIPEKKIHRFKCTYDVWDISRRYVIESSGKGKEDVVVNFLDIDKEGLPCLKASSDASEYESYLLVLPGTLIAELYDDYGERLLEQNVRTFLQFRGNTNKGIRNTILHEPHMFFAYNNGLSATAEKVSTNESGSKMHSITNLQIVNGGQTSASIFTAVKKSKADLKEVYVQVKLTVIPLEHVERVVPKISEYANTQNKVNAADFFSNHPFHLRIEEFSRRLLAPSKDGSLKESYWYYERTRGQYANAQAILTPAAKKKFLVKFPKKQMFNKTDLAKFENSYNMLPHIVSMGAQKNFAKYANDIGEKWQKNEKQYNELFYKQLVAKAIIFRFLDRNLMKQPWYGGYKANIVTYSIAKLVNMVSSQILFLDLAKIWQKQALSQDLENFLLEIAGEVNNCIQDTPEGITNVTEWCKKNGCWEKVKRIPIELPQAIQDECVNNEEHNYRTKGAAKTQKIQNDIMAQTCVFERGAEYWKKMAEWNQVNRFFIFPKELGILKIACCIPTKYPSDKQSKILIQMEKRAVEEGFFIDGITNS
jgi:hypothetical protein